MFYVTVPQSPDHVGPNVQTESTPSLPISLGVTEATSNSDSEHFSDQQIQKKLHTLEIPLNILEIPSTSCLYYKNGIGSRRGHTAGS